MQRAAIGNGDTTLTPVGRRRLPAVGPARAHRPERHRARGRGRLVVARTRTRARRSGCASIPIACSAAFDRVVERASRRAGRWWSSRTATSSGSSRTARSSRPSARAAMQHAVHGAASTRSSGSLLQRVTPRTTPCSWSRRRSAAGAGRLTVASLCSARAEAGARGVELDAPLGRRLDRRHRADDPRPARDRAAGAHGGPADHVRSHRRRLRRPR